MALYEVGIYNKYIRDKILNGEKVEGEQAKWEEIHYFEIEADDEEHATRKMKILHPEGHGFIIECVDRIGGIGN